MVINSAIDSLPASGGTVLLYEGDYDIEAVPNTKGGILIRKNNVILKGLGASTRLHLANHQDVNVIHIIGPAIKNVTVRDLGIDGNRAANDSDNFNACGVRGESSTSTKAKNLVVDSNYISNCGRLCAMLFGNEVRISNNHFGDARSDVAEILYGPGSITDNFVEIRGVTGHGLGSDTANNIRIQNNTVHVYGGGSITQVVYRLWANSSHNILSGNQIVVDAGATINYAVDVRGYLNLVSNNGIHNHPRAPICKAQFNSTSSISGNIFENCSVILINPGNKYPTQFVGNMLVGVPLGNPPPLTTSVNNVFMGAYPDFYSDPSDQEEDE